MPFDRHAKYALLVACITLLLCSLGFRFAVQALNIYLRKEPVELRGTFSTIPRVLGKWTAVGEDMHYDKAVIESLGTSNFLDRLYVMEGMDGEWLNVHVAYYTGMIDAVPHVPKRCFVAAGFEQQSQDEVLPLSVDESGWLTDPGPANLATGLPYKMVEHRDWFTNQAKPARMPVGPLQIRLMEFARKDQRGMKYFGGYFFVANGRVTATPEDIRLLAFKPSERYAYYCKVQFMYAASNGKRERCLELVSGFLKDFLPELMLRLPDWQEVERREQGDRPSGLSKG